LIFCNDIPNSDYGKSYPNIHWVIASYMLRKLPEYERTLIIKQTAEKVSRNLESTIEFARAVRGVPIYKCKKRGEKHIFCITTDPEYRDAKERDYRRGVRWDRMQIMHRLLGMMMMGV
jgi:hypothetical protein